MLGLEGLTRFEREAQKWIVPMKGYERLIRENDDDDRPPPEITDPEMDFFDVSRSDCESNYANQIDNWQLMDTSSIDCGDDPMKVYNFTHTIAASCY